MRKVLAVKDDERIEFNSVREAAGELNLHERNIYSVLAGDRKTSGGYSFEWKGGTEEVLDVIEDSKQITETKDSLQWFVRVPGQVKTLEEALSFCEADLDKWEVEKWIANYWDGKSQVKLFFKPRLKSFDDVTADVLEQVKSWQPLKINKVGGVNKVTLLCSDFHIGADVRNLMKTPDFNINVLQDYLREVSDFVNRKNYEEVNVCFLGDYFESLSGFNHEDSFKSIGQDMWGSNLIITAHKIMINFLSSINNLKTFYVVTGNHDRFAGNKRQENTGEAGKTLTYMIQLSIPDVEVDYNDLLLSKDIDGVNYILTHGDKSVSNKEITKVILDYGKQGKYNLLCQGHLHTARLKSYSKTTLHKFDEFNMIGIDDLDYKSITIPSIFTGNYFSESLGFSGNAGFVLSENNGKGKPNLSFITI